MDRLDHALASSQRAGHPVATLVIDLDGFKPINDVHGHHAGDALLVEIAARMASCSRPADTPARLGGDEFAFVLQQADGRIAAQVAQRVIEAVAMPVSVGDAEVAVGASVGIAVSGSDSQGGEELLRDADEAMYAAKRNGRGQHVVFTPELARQREDSADPSMTVASGDARAWADYIRTLRAEISDRKGTGSLPEGARAPASVFRALEGLLAAIDDLPQQAASAPLGLPDQHSLEEFFFHQTMVDAWAVSLVDAGALDTRRPPQARRFWSDLEAVVEEGSSPTSQRARPSSTG